MNAEMKKLEKYIDAYMDQLPEMLTHHEGKWTVISEDLKPAGFWDTDVSALEAGYNAYGLNTFLLRQVSEEYVKYGRKGKPATILSVTDGTSRSIDDVVNQAV